VLGGEAIGVAKTIDMDMARRVQDTLEPQAKAQSHGLVEDSATTEFLEMDLETQLAVAQSQWRTVLEAAEIAGIDVMSKSSDKALEGASAMANIDKPEGKNAFGTPRDRKAEKGDHRKAPKFCQCMASELLYGITKGAIPYNLNYKGYAFEWDAGMGVSPLWWKRAAYDTGNDGEGECESKNFLTGCGESQECGPVAGNPCKGRCKCARWEGSASTSVVSATDKVRSWFGDVRPTDKPKVVIPMPSGPGVYIKIKDCDPISGQGDPIEEPYWKCKRYDGSTKATKVGLKRSGKYYWDYDSDIKKSGFGMMFRDGIGSNINCHLVDSNRMWIDTSFPSVKF
jgi:hypothetical protein